MSLSLSIIEGNSLVITLCWKLVGDASISNVVYGKGQPLIFGIVVSANLRKSAEVMLRLN